MWIAYQSVDAPVGNNQADNHEQQGHSHAIAHRDAAKIEDDVAKAVQAVVERDEQKGEVDRDEPAVLKERC